MLGAGAMATKVAALNDAALGKTLAGARTLSVSVEMRTVADCAANVAPLIHVHVTETVKDAPKAPYAPRPGRVAVADDAAVAVVRFPRSCAATEEAEQGTAKSSDTAVAPSLNTVIIGAGDIGTTDEPPVSALGSTVAGEVMFTVSVEIFIGADCDVKLAPLTQVQVTDTVKEEPKAA